MEKSQVRVALVRGKPYNRNVKSQKREEIRVVKRVHSQYPGFPGEGNYFP